MYVKFWGVRGSIPSPLSTVQIQNRIAAVVQRITANDIVSQSSKEFFLASLPDWIFGTVGGNTSCVEIIHNSNNFILFDAGSGLKEFSQNLQDHPNYSSDGNTFHIFFSHFHWDHIQGLPFFTQAFNPLNTIYFYSTNPQLQEILENQMKQPYFPVPMIGPGGFNAKMYFKHLDLNENTLKIDDCLISWLPVNHPGGCTAYKITENNKSLVYATDTELTLESFSESNAFFSDVDVLILDSQYTTVEAINKVGWGHTSFSVSADFAQAMNVKKLVFFHHEPTYNDQKIFSFKQSAQWYQEYSGNNKVEIVIAREGLCLLV